MLQMHLGKIFCVINVMCNFWQKQKNYLQSNDLFDINQSIVKSCYWAPAAPVKELTVHSYSGELAVTYVQS